MSGIIGKLSFDHEETLARPVLEQMVGALAHSPLENTALHHAPGLALGVSGLQGHGFAATNERGNLHVVADAQLTNKDALRRQLEGLGHQFATDAVSEVIAHACEQWGPSAFARLRGSFSCAVWDDQERRLLIARDHLGLKPLFFAILHDHGVVFGSRLDALLQDPGVGRTWCAEAVDAYLTLGYIPAPLTAYARVSKLDAGQALVVDGRRFHVEQFWRMPAADGAGNSDERRLALDACIRRVIRRQLATTESAGLLYSGGLASSLLLAAAPRQAQPAITVALNDEDADLARSDAAATSLGRRRELEAVLSPLTLVATQLAGRLEEPIADPSVVARFAVCAAARPHMPAALTGYGASLLWSHAKPRRLWEDTQRRALYTREFAWQVRDGNPLTSDLDAARDLRLRSFIGDNVVASATHAAAAADLDIRFPFLDTEFVELAAGIGPLADRKGPVDAHPLRSVLQGYLPAPLMPPRAQRSQHPWLHFALPSLMRSMVLTPRFDGRGIVSRPFLTQMWEEHQGRRRDHAQRLWSLLVLEFWFREFIDGDAADEPLEYAVLAPARRVA